MKTNIYKVTIFRNGRLHQWYRFIGRVPTTEEMVAAIDRRLDGSKNCERARDAYFSTQIVTEIGIPTEIGPTTGDTWVLVGIEIGKIRVEREDAWTLEATE
jgi:hypothetical protein